MVANVAAPFGFRQFGQREGTAPTAGFERLWIASSDTFTYFTGDVVAMSSGTGSPAGTITLLSTLGSVALSNSVVGVFLGCKYYNSNVGRTVWSAYFPGNLLSSGSTSVEAYVCTNTEQLYIAQGTSGGVLQSSHIGLGIPPSLNNSSAGNTTTGQSVMTVLSSAVTALASNAVFRIIDLYANVAPPGVNGTSSGAEGLQIVVVQPNNWTRKQTVLPSS